MKNYDLYKTQSPEKVISDFSDERNPNFERINEIHYLLSKLDKEKGYPPVIFSETSEKIIPSKIVLMTPSLKMFRKVTKQVLGNKKVKETLGKHWIHVNTQHITQTDTRYQGIEGDIPHFEFRVLFYSYSAGHTIEVLIGGAKKIVINSLFDIYIPETSEEIQKAINIAKKDTRISQYVGELEANAILEPITDEKHPSFKNRVLRVMFTEKYDKFKELPVLFYALVDLNEKKVLIAREAPCIQKTNKNK